MHRSYRGDHRGRYDGLVGKDGAPGQVGEKGKDDPPGQDGSVRPQCPKGDKGDKGDDSHVPGPPVTTIAARSAWLRL